MRTYSLILLFAVCCTLGCSKDMMGGGCGEGMVVCEGSCVLAGTACGLPDAAVAPDASLSALSVTGGALSPAFSSMTTMYTLTVPFVSNAVQVTATAVDSRATIQVNGTQVASGAASTSITVGSGPTMIAVVVQAGDGLQKTYDVLVVRPPLDYLKASNTGLNDYFGHSVALSGDTLAVGAYFEASNGTGVNSNTQGDNSLTQSGAVYVFARSGTVWTQQAYIKASNTGSGDHFGYSVALSGDTLAVGARFEDSNGTGVNGAAQGDNTASGSGAVYVFTRSGTVWSQQAYVKASNTGADDNFGYSVSLAGDTLAVGAYHEASNGTGVNGAAQGDNTAANSGAVYVFTRNGTVWTQQAYVKASNTEAGDLFGGSVALSSDTLAVGATNEDSNGTGVNSATQGNNGAANGGAVYVFTRSGTVWTQQAYIKASNTNGGDLFGYSVALSSDTLAVGARDEDSSGTGVNSNMQSDNSTGDSGAVYVFTRSGTAWTQQAYIKASNPSFGDAFGASVALSSDTLAVGAYYEASNGTGINSNTQSDNSLAQSGAVYVFTRSGTNWTQQSYIKASNPDGGDNFGWSVALSSDALAVGAYAERSDGTGVNSNTQSSNSAPDSGAVYVYR